MTQIYVSCPVPMCERRVLPTSVHKLCVEHEKALTFLLWAIPRIKIEAPKEPALWTPPEIK